MAYIDHIYVHGADMPTDEITVWISMKPAGTHILKTKIPPGFKAALLQMAQTAADHHEALCRADILAEQKENP